jgi:hypothetical protein
MKKRIVFQLSVAWLVMCIVVEGQIGLDKVVDDENLSAFIIRYR